MRRPDHDQVLVVDDDAAIRHLLRVLLEGAGYAVAEADDGERALAALHDSPHPLVVLLDVAMPGPDGIGVLRAVIQHATLRTRHVYILMTASDSGAPLGEAAELLAQIGGEFLPKPFGNKGVLRVVGRAAQRLPQALSAFSAMLTEITCIRDKERLCAASSPTWSATAASWNCCRLCWCRSSSTCTRSLACVPAFASSTRRRWPSVPPSAHRPAPRLRAGCGARQDFGRLVLRLQAALGR